MYVAAQISDLKPRLKAIILKIQQFLFFTTILQQE